MLNKTVIIYDSVDYFIPFMEGKGVQCYPSFRKIPDKKKVLRKISLMFNCFPIMWYGEWKSELKNCNTVIVFASKQHDFIKYLCDNYPSVRVIIWYWNPVAKCFPPHILKRPNLEYWSFDNDDCKTYDLRFNTTFYFDSIRLPRTITNNEVLFVGADKGRKKYLDIIKEILTEKKISTNFHIVPDKGHPNPFHIKTIPYSEYLMKVSQSKVILDYLQKGQAGQTLRPLEAVFFRKKLITNDKNIIKQPFYDPQNIFVIDLNDWSDIEEFVKSDYRDISSKLLEYFDFSSWLNRFDIN